MKTWNRSTKATSLIYLKFGSWNIAALQYGCTLSQNLLYLNILFLCCTLKKMLCII